MSRTLTPQAIQAMMSRDTTEVFLPLLTLYPEGQSPIRLVSNTQDITSRGNVYTAFPFEPVFPKDEEGQIASAKIRLDNVTRSLIDEIRSLASPLRVALEVVLASTPDTVEVGFYDFTLRSVTYDATKLEGTLTLEDFLSEPYPKDIMSAAMFPGQF